MSNEHIFLRPATAADFPAIATLANGRFGTGYLDRAEYDRWLENPDFFLIAEYDGVFGGYAYLMPESIEKAAGFFRLSADYICSVSQGKPILHCRSAALLPEYEHCGLMYALLVRELTDAGDAGFGAAVAPAWKYNGFVPMERLMKKLGFTCIGERPRLWYDIDGYTCIVCNGRCHCDAVLYQKALPAQFAEKQKQ